MGLIPATLAQGRSVRLSGFGTFETRRRAARPQSAHRGAADDSGRTTAGVSRQEAAQNKIRAK